MSDAQCFPLVSQLKLRRNITVKFYFQCSRAK
uniref:Uncharacterized protein n=1 Tax=Arundo donax TaxID=35708 RepID=A0A0A9HME5_ARUDO